MKLVNFLAFLATCTLASGIAGSWNGVAITAWNGVAQTSWNGTGVSQAAGGGWTGNLLSTDFEGAGLPTGWTTNSGSPNYDNASSPLSGAQDLIMSASVVTDVTGNFTDSNEVWIKFRFRLSVLTNTRFIYINGTGSDYLAIGMNSGTGALRIFQGASQVGSDTTDAVAVNTPIFIWFHILKGTGANAVYDFEWNTVDTRSGSGNKFISHSSGTFDEQISNLEPYHESAATGTFQFDDVQVGNTAFP